MTARRPPSRRRALLGLAALALAAADDPRPPEPTDRYGRRDVEGWPVLVPRGFVDDDPGLARRTLELLARQLRLVVAAVPAPAVARLREVRIWVERDEPHHPCMAYHPDPRWLADHGMNPDKARSVEVANARNFLSWTAEQPWMVLHELAHAHHHQALPGGHGNPEVRAAYDRAMHAGLYDSVARVGGPKQRAYAATNPMEYFAEGSEAYFGRNDFFPFDRAELARHDPALAALLARLWGAPPPSP